MLPLDRHGTQRSLTDEGEEPIEVLDVSFKPFKAILVEQLQQLFL